MSVDLAFSKHASSYERYGHIQEEVAKELLGLLRYKPKRILDLGCGQGALARGINWEVEYLLGIDFASAMLERHPKIDGKIECLLGDFDDETLFLQLEDRCFEYILSASALQWSRDIAKLFWRLRRLCYEDFAFAIFTAKTFSTLHTAAQVVSPLPTKEYILQAASHHLPAHSYFTREYRLGFSSTLEALRYIRHSGVSGGRRVLDYKQTKRLIEQGRIKSLEFEVLFLSSIGS